MAGFWRHAHPFELPFKYLSSFNITLFLYLQTSGFLFEPRGVVPFPRDALSSVELEYPSCYIVEEIPVVCYADNRAPVLPERGFKPLHRFGIKVVCRLIKKQYIGLPQKKPAKSHTPPLTARQNVYRRIGFGASECIHSSFYPVIDVPSVVIIDLFLKKSLPVHKLLHPVGIFVNFRIAEAVVDSFILLKDIHYLMHTLLHDLPYLPGLVKKRVLGKMSDCISRQKGNLTLVLLLNTCYYLQKC